MMATPIPRRRSILFAICACAKAWAAEPARAVASAAPTGPVVPGRVRPESSYARYFRVHASISMLGVTIVSVSDVGAGYACVESASTSAARTEGLQFAAAACPDRAAGLNRFGVLKEIITENPSAAVSAGFAGLISASREANLDETARALRARGEAVDVTVMHGRVSNGRAWSRSETVRASSPGSWMDADRLLSKLLEGRETVPGPGADARGMLPFLATMRKAGANRGREFQATFLHASRRFKLNARPSNQSPNELIGVIRDASSGAKTAEFRAAYEAGDQSEIPVRIEYRPRSFLKLVFEETSAPHNQQSIPSLFTKENV